MIIPIDWASNGVVSATSSVRITAGLFPDYFFPRESTRRSHDNEIQKLTHVHPRLLTEFRNLLAPESAGHSVSRYRKPTMTRPASHETIARMASRCDAAVVALAD